MPCNLSARSGQVFRELFSYPFRHTCEGATDSAHLQSSSPYDVLFGVQVISGLLLIADVFVPVALTILAGSCFSYQAAFSAKSSLDEIHNST